MGITVAMVTGDNTRTAQAINYMCNRQSAVRVS